MRSPIARRRRAAAQEAAARPEPHLAASVQHPDRSCGSPRLVQRRGRLRVPDDRERRRRQPRPVAGVGRRRRQRGHWRERGRIRAPRVPSRARRRRDFPARVRQRRLEWIEIRQTPLRARALAPRQQHFPRRVAHQDGGQRRRSLRAGIRTPIVARAGSMRCPHHRTAGRAGAGVSLCGAKSRSGGYFCRMNVCFHGTTAHSFRVSCIYPQRPQMCLSLLPARPSFSKTRHREAKSSTDAHKEECT